MTASDSPRLNRPIVFFGTEDFSAIALEALIAAGFPIAGVVTKHDTKKGRGQSLVEPKVKTIARQHIIPVWQPGALSELVPLITPLEPVVGVLVSFGRIIPQSIIDLFEPGIINVHPSLLPLYRGPSPIEAAILNNDSTTGVSIMQLSAKMDAGPIYIQRTIDLDDYRDLHGNNFTKAGLYQSLGLIGAELLITTLPGIVSGERSPTPQDEPSATYCHLITKQDGVIDWTKPAAQLENEIIAYAGWPGSHTTLAGIDVTITEASAVPTGETSKQYPLVIPAGLTQNGETTFLRVLSLKPAGKQIMSAAAFYNGYGHILSSGDA